MKNYKEYCQWGEAKLADAGIEEAKQDARLLLEWVCGTDRNTLLAHPDREVSDEEAEQYEEKIIRRAQRIPLQQILGTQEFMGLSFWINDKVLIPRQDTEILVEEVLRDLHDGMRILDIGTGSGCILISLLQYSNACSGVGVDISAEALEVAERNARTILDRGQEIAFRQENLLEGLEEKFDIIVSNPPYIRTAVIDTLMPEVKEHEPLTALDGKEDGLYFYREILKNCGKNLSRGGSLYFEIGYDQAGEVRDLMEEAGFVAVEVVKDYAGLDRVVYGIYQESL